LIAPVRQTDREQDRQVRTAHLSAPEHHGRTVVDFAGSTLDVAAALRERQVIGRIVRLRDIAALPPNEPV